MPIDQQSGQPAQYDSLAAGYDATRGWPLGVAATIGAGLAGLLAPYRREARPLCVLEVGAGTGRVLAPLAAQGAWTVGLDISMEMLRRLQAKAPAPATGGALYAVSGDAQRLPFPPGAFDAGLLVHILHLVGDWPPVLAATRRAVRPGGPLVLGLDEQVSGEDAWIGGRWAAHVVAAGGWVPTNRRDSVTAEALAALRAEGATLREVVLAEWTETLTVGQRLVQYRDRCFAASWDQPDAVLPPALAGLESDLRARYGSLDTPIARARSFRVSLATWAG
jgi:SAM-dependent methyltransferase